jgi:CO/xanthine dehydrogenase FAD-binding subunit
MIGAPATRNVGTLGGNLANGSPAMDTGSPLLVVGARVRTRSVRGRRTIALADLLAGPGRVALEPGELIVSVTVPRAPGRGTAYVRLGFRRAMEIAIVGAAASIQLDSAGCCVAGALALTAVAPTCVLVPGVEEVLLGRRPTDELLETAARAAAAVARPVEDVRAGAAYRGAMVPLIARRALDRARWRAAAGAQES